MTDVLRQVIARNRAGTAAAIPSVCSAHPQVLRASLLRAQALDRDIVIEATSNQVNQDGGYTGMRPADFVDMVHNIADAARVDRARIVFGGDHLGPQAWRQLPKATAMAKARTLVRDYVSAGFAKIHLDCAEPCADDPAPLDDGHVAARSADLARVCAQTSNPENLLFVVGTEVPPPGGARPDDTGEVRPTAPRAARATLDAHLDAFGHLGSAIGGLVVQPGVEFSPTQVHALPNPATSDLASALHDHPSVCLEAHSTDYQATEVYPRLARMGFAFQKVGPALTHAYRRALYALDGLRATPRLRQVMESLMTSDPQYWQGHYVGDAETLNHLRHESLADRIRYYWPHPKAQAAVADVLAGDDMDLSAPALERAFAPDVLDRAANLQGQLLQRLVTAEIQLALDPYFFEETA